MCANFQLAWVRKLTGKPALLTIADSESKTPRIHLTDYEGVLPPFAAKSKACRTQPDLDWPEARIAPLISFASPGVNRAAKSLPLAFCVPTFGLPTLFFIINVNNNVDATLIFVNNKCKIKIDMANNLPIEKKVTVVSMLAEGNSIRSIERMTGINRNTIMNLGVRIGTSCKKIMDEKLRGLTCKNIEVDEIWGFVGAYGDVWTFIGLDSDSKLIPSFVVGKRDGYHAKAFMDDLASRVTMRVQISSDSLSAYNDAVERSFRTETDYGQIVKTYSVTPLGKSAVARYSPAEMVAVEKTIVRMPDTTNYSE